MGRIRATVAKGELDRYVQGHVASAQRSIEQALRACRRARASQAVGLARAHRVERDLGRVLAAMEHVGRVTPYTDLGDPDLMPEDERARLWREQREQDRLKELEAQPEPVEVESEEELAEEGGEDVDAEGNE